MALDPLRVEALFRSALTLNDPADRALFLERESGGDGVLLRRLEEMLASHFDSAVTANQTPADPVEPTTDAPSELGQTAEGPPEGFSDRTTAYAPEGPTSSLVVEALIAGRYRLRDAIGQGGMGSVYLAEQVQPVRRQVALKLIKAGMDSQVVLDRFESERQALALMDHPNIAKVLDAGTTEGGRPFFVMELVKGTPLTAYCDEHRLSLPQRLDLFRQICSAVQHAHQKGIIHRDLKPSNILVETHDGKPVPKVIDFGLAKAIGGLQLGDQSMVTTFGSVAGTPLYMAPEQARFNAIDIDTRADVYALGVVLYELLTGSTPIRRESLHRVALDEVLRVIREVEPPTPSRRLGEMDSLPSVAATRQVEPAQLGRFVRGDLEWVVMKALAKERERRYDSAIALAQDLERFANHEPVSAGPPSVTYRFKKFVRRNRGRVVAASLVVAAMIVGIVGTTLGLIEARRQAGIAVAQEHRAEARLAQVERANAVLGSIFEGLDPKKAEKGGRTLLAILGENLDKASAQIEGEAIGDAIAVARTQVTLGTSQLNLGHFEKAIDLFSKARSTFAAELGPEHPETNRAVNNLGLAYQQAGKFDRAIPLLEEALAIQKTTLGADHPDTLGTMSNVAVADLHSGKLDRALVLLKEALPLMKAKLGPDHPVTLDTMNNLGLAYRQADQLDQALPILDEALEIQKVKLGPDHPDTLITMFNIAEVCRVSGKLDRALSLLEEAVPLQKARLGPDHRDTLTSINNLAVVYLNVGKLDQALPLLEDVLAAEKAKLGPDHPDTLACLANLASYYWRVGRLDRSVPLFEESVRATTAKLGADNALTAQKRANLGSNYKDAGQLDAARPVLEQAVRDSRKFPPLYWAAEPLLDVYLKAGQLQEAETLTREQLAESRAVAPPASPRLAESLAHRGLFLMRAKRWDEAEPLLRQSLSITEAAGTDAWTVFLTKSRLGGALLGLGKFAEAEPLLNAGYEGLMSMKDRVPVPRGPRIIEALDRLIDLAEATNKPDDEKKWKDAKARLLAGLASKPGPAKK